MADSKFTASNAKAIEQVRKIVGHKRRKFHKMSRWELYRALAVMGYSHKAIALIFEVSKHAVFRAVASQKYGRPADMELVAELEQAGVPT
jgi:hypothetical protein